MFSYFVAGTELAVPRDLPHYAVGQAGRYLDMLLEGWRQGRVWSVEQIVP